MHSAGDVAGSRFAGVARRSSDVADGSFAAGRSSEREQRNATLSPLFRTPLRARPASVRRTPAATPEHAHERKPDAPTGGAGPPGTSTTGGAGTPDTPTTDGAGENTPRTPKTGHAGERERRSATPPSPPHTRARASERVRPGLLLSGKAGTVGLPIERASAPLGRRSFCEGRTVGREGRRSFCEGRTVERQRARAPGLAATGARAGERTPGLPGSPTMGRAGERERRGAYVNSRMHESREAARSGGSGFSQRATGFDSARLRRTPGPRRTIWECLGQVRGFIRRRRWPLAAFLRIYLSAVQKSDHAATRSRGARAAPLFPCARPERWVSDTPPASARRRARWQVHRAAQTIVEWQFGVSSYLACGEPRRPPRGLRAPCTAAHESALGRAREAALTFVRLGLRQAPDLGSGRRGPTLVEQLAALRDEIAKACASGAGYVGPGRVARAMGTPVQPLVASRLAMPERSGTFDLASFLTPKVRASYEDPERLRDWPPGIAPPVPRCGLLPLSVEWLRLLARMDGCGLLDLADVDEVPRGPAGENLAASFFATTKDAAQDRTVVNRVRRNAQEKRLGLVGPVFPHGSSLCEVHLRDGEDLRVSADDLPDFYHTCSISRARALSNAVGRPVPLHVAQGWSSWARFVERHPEAAARARRRGVVQPLWNALPMGDGNAVDYAQIGHCNVLRAGGALRGEHLIAYRDPWPRGPTAEGVMVDDHVVTQVVPRGSPRTAALRRAEGAPRGARFGDEEILQRSSRAYAAARLAPKPAKSVRFAAQVEVWGAHVDGRRGAVRSKLDVHWRALALTLDLLALGRASVEMWRAAVSLWVHVLLFRRCSLALLQHVFQFGDSSGRSYRESDPRDVLPIQGRAASELLALVVFSPLFETDLRARWAEELVCTDASSAWGASVAARVAPEVTAELWRHRDRRGGYVRVGDDWETLRAAASLSSERDQLIVENAARLADSAPVPAPEVDPATWLEDLVAHLPWKQKLRFHMPGSDHINVKEAKAYCADVRRVAADPSQHGTRRMTGLDSRVVTGANAKGRSSSARLNAPLRRVVPDQLLGGLYYGSNFVRTHVNPADDPTRGRRPRGIEGAPCPAWLGPLLRGDPSEFDRALPAARRQQLRKVGLFPCADLQ